MPEYMNYIAGAVLAVIFIGGFIVAYRMNKKKDK